MAARTMRTLLRRLGVGDFNITMCVPFMFIAPATTDPRSPPIITLVKHVQRALNELGAGVPETGYLNVPTAQVLEELVGPGWEGRSWADNIRAVTQAKDDRLSLAPELELDAAPPVPEAVGFFDLPDVPGGVLTYALAAYLLYRHLNKGRRS